ncbi:hypothetical protein [Tenacibaculum sp. SDUM215027]|uniref:hypothetical protein n=1 Tax=Tenacibaculum sp. SDUM215027 TaxID=3422596 RepID=UPI003D31D683
MDYSIETIQIVDIRVITFNIDSQEVMTEDNVACSIAAEKNSTILFPFPEEMMPNQEKKSK